MDGAVVSLNERGTVFRFQSTHGIVHDLCLFESDQIGSGVHQVSNFVVIVGIFLPEERSRGSKPTTRTHLVPLFRIYGVTHPRPRGVLKDSGAPRNFFRGGGRGSTNSVEDRGQRERGSGGGSPLIRGSGGSCNFVQEISFHMVTFSSFLVL